MPSIRCILFFVLVQICFLIGSAQNLEVTIRNIRTNRGQLCVALFNSSEGFKKEQPCWEKNYDKYRISRDAFSFTISIAPGAYGLSVLDDENRDGKMNYNWIGVPLEGFGLSGYIHKGIRKPSFNDFIFRVDANQTIKIEVEMKYY